MSRSAPSGLPRGVLANPTFRRLWLGNTASSTVRWLDLVALGIFSFDLTDSPSRVALVFFFRMLPRLLLSIPIGALVDRVDRRTLLLTVQSLQAGTAAVVATLVLVDVIAYWQVLVFAFVSGGLWTGEFSLRRALIADVVDRRQIGRAAGVDWTTDSVARVAGPALGGGLVGGVGADGAYYTAAGIFVVAAIAIATLPRAPGREPDDEPKRSAVGDLREGLRFLRTQSILVGALVVTVVLNTVFLPHASFLAVIGKDILEAGPLAVGTLSACEGAGSVVGSLWVAARVRESHYTRVYLVGALVFALAVLAFSQSEIYVLSALILFVGGVGIAAFATMQTTLFTSSVPAQMRGRVLGAASLSIGSGPIGALEASVLTGPLGPQTTLSIMALQGIGALGLSLLVWPSMLRRYRTTAPD